MTSLQQQAADLDPFWKSTALHVISHLAHTGRVFEAYDLAREGLPEPRHPNQWGAVLHAAHKAGLIEPAGYGPSARPTTKGSAVRMWRGRTLKHGAVA